MTQDISDEELIDEEEIDYDEEEELGSDEEEDDLGSDIDDTDLMKRLEAKYGKISGENSEDDDDPEAWTSNYGDRQLTILFNTFHSSLIPFSLSECFTHQSC
jgi:hypothetical protein